MKNDVQALRDYRDMLFRVEALKENIMRIKSAMEYQGSNLSGMPRPPSNDPDKLTEPLSKIEDLSLKYNDQLNELAQKMDDAYKIVERQPYPKDKILYLRYIAVDRSGRPYDWAAIARLTHYDESHCRRIEKAALKDIEKYTEMSVPTGV